LRRHPKPHVIDHGGANSCLLTTDGMNLLLKR
jgi:hypothetical protein